MDTFVKTSPCAFGDCVDVEEYKLLEAENWRLKIEIEELKKQLHHLKEQDGRPYKGETKCQP